MVSFYWYSSLWCVSSTTPSPCWSMLLSTITGTFGWPWKPCTQCATSWVPFSSHSRLSGFTRYSDSELKQYCLRKSRSLCDLSQLKCHCIVLYFYLSCTQIIDTKFYTTHSSSLARTTFHNIILDGNLCWLSTYYIILVNVHRNWFLLSLWYVPGCWGCNYCLSFIIIISKHSNLQLYTCNK